MKKDTGLSLERDGVVIANTVEEINTVLAPGGIRVWALDLRDTPEDIGQLLDKQTLTESENKRVKAHFLLSREHLLRIIADAGRRPVIQNGGDLTTYCRTSQIQYPQLHVIEGSGEYSKFLQLHANISEDGLGIDEVGQMLSGSLMKYRYRLPEGDVVTLSLSCPTPRTGWLFTFYGGNLHSGILADTALGSKILIQAIGPAEWKMQYEN